MLFLVPSRTSRTVRTYVMGCVARKYKLAQRMGSDTNGWKCARSTTGLASG